ncbi:MAG TPA: exosortase [Terriglobales bacterium]|jgi:exosortase
MTFSALIPTKNRPDDLVGTIASLLAQTVLPIELLVVDQGRDDSAERAVRALFDANGTVVKLRYFRTPEIRGLLEAREFAVRHAQGEILLFLDDDIELEPDYAAQLLALYRDDPKLTGAAGVITNYRPPAWTYLFWRTIFCRGVFRDERPALHWQAFGRTPDQARNLPPVPVSVLGGAQMSFRAAALRGYHCLDIRPGCPRGEDISYCVGLGPQARFLITPRARLCHHRSQSGSDRSRWRLAERDGIRGFRAACWPHNFAAWCAGEWLRLGYCLPEIAACALAAFALVIYWPVLTGLVGQWYSDPNYGHGFLVAPLAVYLLWRSRHRWRRQPLRPSPAGAAIMILAAAMLVFGRLAAELFFARISLLVGLAGVIVLFAGWRRLRAWAFPFGFLFLMIPLPAVIYYQITFPLQLVASRLASCGLDLLQIPALREGNTIMLPNYTMSVADACSGIRSLFSLITLAVGYSYFTESRLRIRALLVICMVPIAIFANAMRILGTGVLTYDFGPRYAEGFFHAFSGWLIFVVSLGLLLVLHAALRRRWRTPRPIARPVALAATMKPEHI